MHDQSERDEQYEELAAYTSRRAALPSADQVRSAGTKRLLRRRFGQATAAAGTLAVAGVLAVSLPTGSSHATTIGAAAAGGTSPSLVPSAAPSASAHNGVATGGPATRPTHGPSVYAGTAPSVGASAGPGGPSRSTEYVITLENKDYVATTRGTTGSPDIYGLGFKGSDVIASLELLGFQVKIEQEHSTSIPAGEIIAITSPLEANEMGTDVSPAENILVLHISLGS